MCQMNFHLIRLDETSGNEENVHHIEPYRFTVERRRFAFLLLLFLFSNWATTIVEDLIRDSDIIVVVLIGLLYAISVTETFVLSRLPQPNRQSTDQYVFRTFYTDNNGRLFTLP